MRYLIVDSAAKRTRGAGCIAISEEAAGQQPGRQSSIKAPLIYSPLSAAPHFSATPPGLFLPFRLPPAAPRTRATSPRRDAGRHAAARYAAFMPAY